MVKEPEFEHYFLPFICNVFLLCHLNPLESRTPPLSAEVVNTLLGRKLTGLNTAWRRNISLADQMRLADLLELSSVTCQLLSVFNEIKSKLEETEGEDRSMSI